MHKRKTGDEGRSDNGKAAKQQRRVAPQRPAVRPSKFEELLGDLNVRLLCVRAATVHLVQTILASCIRADPAGWAAFNARCYRLQFMHGLSQRMFSQPASGKNAETALQRHLAKKLGLKSRRDGLGGDDGLDDLLDGLDVLDSADSGTDSEADQDLVGSLDSDIDGEGSEEEQEGSGEEHSDEDSALRTEFDSDEAVPGGAAVANGHRGVNGRLRRPRKVDTVETGAEVDSEDIDSEGERSDDDNDPTAEEDGSDADTEAAVAERRRSSAAATASERRTAGAAHRTMSSLLELSWRSWWLREP